INQLKRRPTVRVCCLGAIVLFHTFGSLSQTISNTISPASALAMWNAVSNRWSKVTIQTVEQEADNGDKTAQYYLGRAYTDGLGVPKNREHAQAWYRKAADQGLALAQFRLGWLAEYQEEL